MYQLTKIERCAAVQKWRGRDIILRAWQRATGDEHKNRLEAASWVSLSSVSSLCVSAGP